MPFCPDTHPKETLTVLVAALLLTFNDRVRSSSEAFQVAEEFVVETEKRTGRLNP
jgi:hypothetical protein